MLTPEAIKELAKAQAIDAANNDVSKAIADSAVVSLPNDFGLHDLEKYLPLRRRSRGHMTTNVVPDFASYVMQYRKPGAVVFINQAAMSAVAVLNLGTVDNPGHADDLASLAAKKTAAYEALLKIANGQPVKQSTAAEFIEDWAPFILCQKDGETVPTPRAIAAIRKITIEGMKKLEAAEGQLSASRSTFEQIEATSTEPLPTLITFAAIPFHGLQPRNFGLRLGIRADEKNPAVTLRIVNAEQHDEEMAAELADLVRGALQDKLPVLVGAYRAST